MADHVRLQNLLETGTPSPDKIPGYYTTIKQTKVFMLSYVNFIEKRRGMKNYGIKIQEKDQIYVKLAFHNTTELKL